LAIGDASVKGFKLRETYFYELEMVIGGARNFKHIGILTLANMLP
jgi:hypothetical protein